MDDDNAARGETPEPADGTPAGQGAQTSGAEGAARPEGTDAIGPDSGAEGSAEHPSVEDEAAADSPEAASRADTRTPRERRRLGRGATIALVVGGIVVVALLVIGIVAAVNAARVAAEQPRKDAAAAVRAYLTDISHSDSSAALAHLSGGSKLDQTLLTDDVLKASNLSAPLTGIHVVTPTSDAGNPEAMHVTASYLIGSDTVNTAFDLHTDAKGAWLITDGTAKVTVSTAGFTGMALTVNGAKISGAADLDSFPGTYTLGTTTSGFEIVGDKAVTVKDAESAPSLASAKAQLTSSGLKDFRFAVDKDVKGCISSTKLKTGCGLSLPSKLSDGTKLTDGTVRRSLPSSTQKALANLKPNDAASDGVKRRANPIGGVNVTVKCVKGGASGTCQIANGTATYLGSSSVDMSHEPPKVTWTAQ